MCCVKVRLVLLEKRMYSFSNSIAGTLMLLSHLTQFQNSGLRVVLALSERLVVSELSLVSSDD